MKFAAYRDQERGKGRPNRLCENAREKRAHRMFFSGVVSLRRLRAIFALELTELRLCFYTKNERRNFHSAC
jgi:hypothetical protein